MPAVLVLSLWFAAQAAAPDAQALQRMAATERAFAAATAEIGVRDGFLAFFADDAVQIVAPSGAAPAALTRARDALARMPPPRLPLASRLLWEPCTGQVSGDGTMGWLTGPYVTRNDTTGDITSQGAYFSVWKRQADGTWRVWLDEGIALPAVWQGATPFRAAPEATPDGPGEAAEPVAAAERDAAAGGAGWRTRLSGAVRVHRDGRMPIEGRDAAAAWAASAWSAVRYRVLRLEEAASGDLAVAIGGYDADPLAGGPPERGTWIRVWQRAVTGPWRIVFETSRAAR